MTNTEKLIAELALRAALTVQTEKGSTASHAKDADYSVRDYLMARGVGSTADIRCRPSSMHDWTVYVKRAGKTVRVNGETKVGTGAVRYGATAESVALEPDAIYPNTDYIVYCAEPDKLKAHPERKGRLFRVFSREQFLACLEDCGRNGLSGSLRVHQTKTGTWQLEIIAWKTPNCCARLARYEDWIKANNVPTLEQFRAWLRG